MTDPFGDVFDDKRVHVRRVQEKIVVKSRRSGSRYMTKVFRWTLLILAAANPDNFPDQDPFPLVVLLAK